MPALLHLQDRQWQVDTPQPLASALANTGLAPESYLYLRRGMMIDPGENLEDGDEVTLIPAIAGG
jgi:sulfur carrier protein ThiS